MIDTHCHLTFPDFAGRVEEILGLSRSMGISGAITISTSSKDCLAARDLAARHDNLWHTSGIHPLYTDQAPHDWSKILESALSPKCVAWGELGLDRNHKEPPLDVQLPVLHKQLAFIENARKGRACPEVHPGGHRPLNLPIVLHCREAFADLIPILRGVSLDPARYVFHCFTGGPDDMRALLDFGAMVSFTGVATYKSAKALHEAIKLAPLDRILIETDSPFLSPEPHRGAKPCIPGYAIHTARAVAHLKGLPWEVFREAVNANTARFFGIDVAATLDAAAHS